MNRVHQEFRLIFGAGHKALVALGVGMILLSPALPAQQSMRQTLTPAQVEAIRNAGIDPNARISLYVKFLNEHVDTIRQLAKEGLAPSRARKVDVELQTVASLTDELGSNLDQYGGRKADIRKALKKLNEDLPKWQEAMQALPKNPAFSVSRDDALASCQDLTQDAAQMWADQKEYFKEHKDQRGQERAEPQ